MPARHGPSPHHRNRHPPQGPFRAHLPPRFTAATVKARPPLNRGDECAHRRDRRVDSLRLVTSSNPSFNPQGGDGCRGRSRQAFMRLALGGFTSQHSLSLGVSNTEWICGPAQFTTPRTRAQDGARSDTAEIVSCPEFRQGFHQLCVEKFCSESGRAVYTIPKGAYRRLSVIWLSTGIKAFCGQ